MSKSQIVVISILALVACSIFFVLGIALLFRVSTSQQDVSQAPSVQLVTTSTSQPASASQANAPEEGTIPAQRSGQATKDLGHKSVSFGSTQQAQELLRLIEENPGKTDYQISYQTDEDVVLFGCNFDKEVIIRIHQRSDDHGTQEVWQGYIFDRLKAASDGGSLNDTPEGKNPGTFQSF